MKKTCNADSKIQHCDILLNTKKVGKMILIPLIMYLTIAPSLALQLSAASKAQIKNAEENKYDSTGPGATKPDYAYRTYNNLDDALVAFLDDPDTKLPEYERSKAIQLLTKTNRVYERHHPKNIHRPGVAILNNFGQNYPQNSQNYYIKPYLYHSYDQPELENNVYNLLDKNSLYQDAVSRLQYTNDMQLDSREPGAKVQCEPISASSSAGTKGPGSGKKIQNAAKPIGDPVAHRRPIRSATVKNYATVQAQGPRYLPTKYQKKANNGAVFLGRYNQGANDDGLEQQYDANPQYSYSYGVNDRETGDSKSFHESRNGDWVQGHYSFMDPDGKLRTVQYTADGRRGFRAVVDRVLTNSQ